VEHHLGTLDVIAESPSTKPQAPLALAGPDVDQLLDLVDTVAVVRVVSEDRDGLAVPSGESLFRL
jgi:hypothetical protein